MRRKQRGSGLESALELLKNAHSYELASTAPNGEPVLRTLDGVVHDDWLLFHGALVGEKVSCLGRPCVVGATHRVAMIPSTFVDPERACPATTYYQSVQAKGILEEVTSESLKKQAFQALMEKGQPEGGYRPFKDGCDFYKKDLKAVRVFGLRLADVSGKESLGQDRPAERTQKVVEGLFRRGAPGDLEAIELVLSRSPQARPAEWRGVGFELVVAPSADQLAQHAELLQAEYWKANSSVKDTLAALEAASAWIGALDSEGRLLGAVRAMGDRTWDAKIYDMVVAPESRGRGIGAALMTLLLQHPLLRACRITRLATRDAGAFYERFGFRNSASLDGSRQYPQMLRTAAKQ